MVGQPVLSLFYVWFRIFQKDKILHQSSIETDRMSTKIKRQHIHPLVRFDIHTLPIAPPLIPNKDRPPPPVTPPTPETKEASTQTDPVTSDLQTEYIISSVLNKLPTAMKQTMDRSEEKNPDLDLPFLLIHTRDIEPEEKELLKTYGVVFEWDPSFVNIPLSAHPFRYCFLNLHHKDVRMLLMKTDLSPYHVVIVSRTWESEDDFHEDIQARNVIHSFPPRQAFAADFNRLLLTPKIRKPSCAKAMLRFLFRVCNGC